MNQKRAGIICGLIAAFVVGIMTGVLGSGGKIFTAQPRETAAASQEVSSAKIVKKERVNFMRAWRFQFEDGVECIVISGRSVSCNWPHIK